MTDEIKPMTLETGDWFTLKEEDPKSMFKDVNVFVRNNGSNIVKVVSDANSILLTIEKREK